MKDTHWFEFVPLQNRSKITVLKRKQKPCLIWFSCRRKSYPVDCVEWHKSLKVDVARDDSQRRFLAKHSITTSLRHCFEWLQHCSNIATLCFAQNRRCESSRVTSTYLFLSTRQSLHLKNFAMVFLVKCWLLCKIYSCQRYFHFFFFIRSTCLVSLYTRDTENNSGTNQQIIIKPHFIFVEYNK